MMSWVRKHLRSWLEIPEPKKEERITSLECIVGGHLKLMMVGGVCGMKLRVHDNRDTYLIGPTQAADQSRFWAAWRQYNTKTYTWADGTPFVPGE